MSKAKDPAFLFYPGDASEDTQFMNRLERGAYFDLVKAQRMFNHGFTTAQLRKILGSDFETVWPSLEIILTQEGDLYFIDWLKKSFEKREEYSKKQSERSKKGWQSRGITTVIPQKEDGNENENEEGIETKNKKSAKTEKNKKPKKSEPEFPEFQECMAAYHEFYKSLTGVPPNIKVQDGKALKDLILHFRSIANEGQSIVDGFRYVFKNWQKLDPFYQKQIDLTRIYTNINPIISELKTKRKNANSNTGNTDYESAEFKRSVNEKIDKIFAER